MKCVVLAGAGASYAVNSEQYPTTAHFVERLPKQIKDNALYKLIVSIISEQEDEPIDIEKVLWRLEELRSHLQIATKASGTVGRAYTKNRLATIIGGDTDTFYTAAPQYLRHIDLLVADINKVVYELYAHMPRREELEPNWILLLSGLCARSHSLNIFTTNYDRVIERAENFVNKMKPAPKLKLHSGHVDDVERELDVSLWSENPLGRSLSGTKLNGLLTKLHGSVDWNNENEKIVIGGAFYKGDHSRHAILYPGLTGLPNVEPFKSFHGFFDRTLNDADHMLVIGFAFRDDAINHSIESASRRATFKSLVVIDPTKQLVLPKGIPAGKIVHIASGFDAAAVGNAFLKLK